MKQFRIIFGGTEKRPLWYSVIPGAEAPDCWRENPDGSAFCIDCGENLTFCFPPRTGGQSVYTTPTSVRCDCFLDGPQTEKLLYSRIFKREPLPIILVDPPAVA
jgi:hypothetical protein